MKKQEMWCLPYLLLLFVVYFYSLRVKNPLKSLKKYKKWKVVILTVSFREKPLETVQLYKFYEGILEIVTIDCLERGEVKYCCKVAA